MKKSPGTSGGDSAPRVELPIRYFESNLMVAAFPASTARLQELTPSPLRVVEAWPGRAPLAIAAYEYTRTTIGPYGEVGIAWPVVDARRKPPPLVPLLLEQHWPGLGYWIHRLPVTSQAALEAGRSIWGYPKFLADIGFEWDGATRICTLSEGGRDILRLSIDTRMPAVPQRFPMRLYSVLDDELLTTTIDVDAVGLQRRLLASARVTLGPHPKGRELAELGVSFSRPLEVRWFPVLRAVLPMAEKRRRLERTAPADPAQRSGVA